MRIISAKFGAAPSSAFNAGRAAIGTGPYVLREYEPGSRVVLDRIDKLRMTASGRRVYFRADGGAVAWRYGLPTLQCPHLRQPA